MNIIILGGGYSGVLAAKKLRKKTKGKEVRITLIDKNPFHTLLTELHEAAAGRISEEAVKIDFKKIFTQRDISVVTDEIKEIDFEQKKLTGIYNEYSYDYLIISSGSKPAFYEVSGACKNAFTLWSYDDAVKLNAHILEMFRCAEREQNTEKRLSYLTFCIVGAGLTGVEMAGELAEWIPELCQKFNIGKNEPKICLFDVQDRILTAIPEKPAKKVHNRLKKSSVNILSNVRVSKVDKGCITFSGKNGAETRLSQTVIWSAGIEGSDIVSGLNVKKQEGSRIETNAFLQLEQYKNVYVTGDNLYIVPSGGHHPVPQMVENCEQSAKTAVHNLIADINKNGTQKKYVPKFHGTLISVGGKWGTAYVGSQNKKFVLPSFFAMFAKHFMNVLYLLQILGWNKAFSYMKNEVFKIHSNRSFTGGHFSNYSPNFWLVPLRLFLGYNWLSEGLNKLPRLLKEPNNIFLFNTAQSDATASATMAAENYGNVLPVPEFLSNTVDYMTQVFIMPVAPYFQFMLVFTEIIIGIMIFTGFFTTAASAASVFICIMIYLSGMAETSILWYIVSSIALIGVFGTGHVFAADYYVLPWLKEKWRRLRFVRKWYLYND